MSLILAQNNATNFGTYASRTAFILNDVSGERVRNAFEVYLIVGNLRHKNTQ